MKESPVLLVISLIYKLKGSEAFCSGFNASREYFILNRATAKFADYGSGVLIIENLRDDADLGKSFKILETSPGSGEHHIKRTSDDQGWAKTSPNIVFGDTGTLGTAGKWLLEETTEEFCRIKSAVLTGGPHYADGADNNQVVTAALDSSLTSQEWLFLPIFPRAGGENSVLGCHGFTPYTGNPVLAVKEGKSLGDTTHENTNASSAAQMCWELEKCLSFSCKPAQNKCRLSKSWPYSDNPRYENGNGEWETYSIEF